MESKCDQNREAEGQVYNIENDVIQKCHKSVFITSKTMLYTIDLIKCITSKTMLYAVGKKVYNIENDVQDKCITSKTMLYIANCHKSV